MGHLAPTVTVITLDPTRPGMITETLKATDSVVPNRCRARLAAVRLRADQGEDDLM